MSIKVTIEYHDGAVTEKSVDQVIIEDGKPVTLVTESGARPTYDVRKVDISIGNCNDRS